jgi:hypothetical protein
MLDFARTESVHAGVAMINSKGKTMNTTNLIQNHINYSADDYAYLVAKGWTDEQILARWDQEATAGAGPCLWQTESARSKLAAVTGRR